MMSPCWGAQGLGGTEAVTGRGLGFGVWQPVLRDWELFSTPLTWDLPFYVDKLHVTCSHVSGLAGSFLKMINLI